MVVSSRTPEGWSNECPICGRSIRISPSEQSLDAPCPNCGSLIWFVPRDQTLEVAGAIVYDDINKAANSLPSVLPDDLVIPPQVRELVPASVARENGVVPLEERLDRVVLAYSDPLDLECYDKLQFILNCKISIVHTDSNWIDRKIEECYA